MSIDIEVGIFLDEDDSLFSRHYRQQFEVINAFLRSIGFPEHHEPADFGGQDTFHRSGKSELPPFNDMVSYLEERTGICFPHILEPSHENSIYLPFPFEHVLWAPSEWGIEIVGIGSAMELFAECRVMAKILGIYDDIEDDLNAFGVAQFSRDPVVLKLEKMLGLEEREKQIPFSLMREQILTLYPGLAENPWSVVGVGACMKLYEAAKFSIKHQAALVIH